MEGRQVVTEVDAEGCPSAPEVASTKFVNQCGVIVRARIPITTRLWKTSKPEEQQHAVLTHQKEMLWAKLKDMFTLPEGDDQRYPVDDVIMPTLCELHVRARNISIHVAYGSTLPLNPSTTIH